MALIDVNPREMGWLAVRKYVETRRAEILEEMLSLTTDDRERRDAAVRIDELTVLLRAPDETRAMAESLQASDNGASGIY